MRLRWHRSRVEPRHLAAEQRWPDGDTVVPPGGRRTAEVLREEWDGPTQPMPIYQRRLMTPAARWRFRRRPA